MIDYLRLFTEHRNDQRRKLKVNAPTMFHHPMTSIQAATASGKTSNMIAVSGKWYKINPDGRVIVIVPNEGLVQRHKVEWTRAGFRVIERSVGGKKLKVVGDIAEEAAAPGPAVILLTGISHSGGDLTATAKLLRDLLRMFHRNPTLVHIDELHELLTELTGGINGSIYHSTDKLATYRGVIEQSHGSKNLNIFDIFREANACVIGWSATLNNVVASKLGSMGYDYADILFVAVAPIPELYSTKPFVKFNPDRPEEFIPLMLAIEERGPILCIFPDKKKLDWFCREYEKFTGKPIPATEITYRTKHSDLAAALAGSKYVLGIDKICTGYDHATLTGQNLAATFIFRKFSDRASQPIAGNEDHPLYNEYSALLIQAAGRGRDSKHTVYVTTDYLCSVLDLHQKLFALAHDAVVEATRYGPVQSAQNMRLAHCVYVALAQNLSTDRPVVREDLAYLKELTDRDLAAELARPDCDHAFWHEAVCEMLECLVATADSPDDLPDIMRAAKRRILQRGGGERKVREMDAAELAKIEARANGRCCHCCRRFLPVDKRQMVHMDRHDCGGDATAANGMLGHPECDAAFDASRFIHDPDGEHYWVQKEPVFLAEPHLKQLRGIDRKNIVARWTWVRGELKIPAHADMRTWLSENGYVAVAYDD